MKKMAIFIGSDLQTGNWGEDFLIEKLMEYIDALLDFNEKQGKEVEDYVPFDISAVALMIDPGNN